MGLGVGDEKTCKGLDYEPLTRMPDLKYLAISIITNKVNQAAQEWQNRPLDPVYLIVWMILPILTFQPINCFGNFVH